MNAIATALARWLPAGIFACVIALSNGHAAHAASFNIDFVNPGIVGGGGATGAPAGSYGAAAGQTGAWNAIPSADGVYTLDDLSGTTTGVKLDVLDTTIVPVTVSTGFSGGDADLMEDFFAAGASPWQVFFKDLPSGTYDLWVYGPSGGSHSTSPFLINSASGPPDLSGSGGPVLVSGLDYVLLSGILVTNGTLFLNQGATELFGDSGLSGLQLTQVSAVPVPAALPLFLTGLAALGYFGRKRARAA